MKRISVLRDGVGRLDLHPPAVAAGDSVSKPWAWQALENYEPKDVPESEKQQWDEEVDVRCPSCRSKDIQFEELVETANGVPPKFKWTCSVCGHEWQDDGVATKG